MKTIFLTTGEQDWASSRYRCYWPAKYMRDAMVYKWAKDGPIPDDCDVYIWQKVASLELVDQIHKDGKLQFWDLCDPVHWWQPKEAKYIADRCNGVVCSSQALTDDWSEWYGIPGTCVPDRFEMSHFTGGRAQYGHADPLRFIWYGIANNRFALLAALANLERLEANGVNLTLTIYDDQPQMSWQMTNAFPIYYSKWALNQEVKTIAAHDISILPPYPGPWGRVKSDNKRVMSLLCGVPWHDGQDYEDLLELATSAQLREDRANEGRANGHYDVKTSAEEWEALIEQWMK